MPRPAASYGIRDSRHCSAVMRWPTGTTRARRPPEPDGGAHNDHDRAAELLDNSLAKHLAELKSRSITELVECRYEKFRHMGQFFSEQ